MLSHLRNPDTNHFMSGSTLLIVEAVVDVLTPAATTPQKSFALGLARLRSSTRFSASATLVASSGRHRSLHPLGAHDTDLAR